MKGDKTDGQMTEPHWWKTGTDKTDYGGLGPFKWERKSEPAIRSDAVIETTGCLLPILVITLIVTILL